MSVQNDGPLTKAEIAGGIGLLLSALAVVVLVITAVVAVICKANEWSGWVGGWFKTALLVVMVSTAPVFGLGLFLLGHPPLEGPRFMRDHGLQVEQERRHG